MHQYPDSHYRPFGTIGLSFLIVLGLFLLALEKCGMLMGC